MNQGSSICLAFGPPEFLFGKGVNTELSSLQDRFAMQSDTMNSIIIIIILKGRATKNKLLGNFLFEGQNKKKNLLKML